MASSHVKYAFIGIVYAGICGILFTCHKEPSIWAGKSTMCYIMCQIGVEWKQCPTRAYSMILFVIFMDFMAFYISEWDQSVSCTRTPSGGSPWNQLNSPSQVVFVLTLALGETCPRRFCWILYHKRTYFGGKQSSISLLTNPPSQKEKALSIIHQGPPRLIRRMAPRPMLSNPTIICRACEGGNIVWTTNICITAVSRCHCWCQNILLCWTTFSHWFMVFPKFSFPT